MTPVPVFSAQSRLEHPVADAFAWHTRPGALERMLPPWQDVRVVEATGGIDPGARVVIELRAGPLRTRWVAVHTACEPGVRFVDEMARGPFARWVHEHRFAPDGEAACAIEDRIEYALPGGPAGGLAAPLVDLALRRTFGFRHARLRDDLDRHSRMSDAGRLRVVVSGATGLIGSQLTAFLGSGGHRVERLVRRAPQSGEVFWDPARGEIDAAALEGTDAFVHLAGESIDGRWTAAKKRRIRESRALGTRLLAETIAGLRSPPRALVAASAVGYYGDRGDALLDEESGSGTGFLAEVCTEWEDATAPAGAAGVRVVNARFGVVLGARGGALARLLPAFRLGVGGPVGSGDQFLSWIALDDVVGALHHLLFARDVSGPVNLVAPAPVTSRELARALGRVLRRPSLLPLPAVAVRLALGEMGEELLLAGQRVSSARLESSGFRFLHPDLESALRAELGRPASRTR